MFVSGDWKVNEVLTKILIIYVNITFSTVCTSAPLFSTVMMNNNYQ